MKKLFPLILLSLLIQSFCFAVNSEESPEDNLVFAHSKYSLKEFTFLSTTHSLGIVKEPFQSQTLVVLYNEHNLVIDSFYADWEIENVIPESDSIFYLQNRSETVKCLIRKDQLYIHGQFSSTVNDPDYEKIAFYTLPLDHADFNIVKSAKMKKSYAMRVSRDDQNPEYYPFNTRRKQMNFNFNASRNELYLFLLDDQRIFKLDKNELSIEEINLESEERNTEWHFYFDYLNNKSYLLSETRKSNTLFLLEANNQLSFIKDLDFVPEAIFNGYLHKKSTEGKLYSHYLIPIEVKEKEKSILLEEVEISSD